MVFHAFTFPAVFFYVVHVFLVGQLFTVDYGHDVILVHGTLQWLWMLGIDGGVLHVIVVRLTVGR